MSLIKDAGLRAKRQRRAQRAEARFDGGMSSRLPSAVGGTGGASTRRRGKQRPPWAGPLAGARRSLPVVRRYPTEVLSLQHRLEPGDYPRDVTAIVAHDLFGFAKHRLRLDLCELIQRKVAERPGANLAETALPWASPARAAAAQRNVPDESRIAAPGAPRLERCSLIWQRFCSSTVRQSARKASADFSRHSLRDCPPARTGARSGTTG